MCLACLRADVPTCLACLHAHVPTCVKFSLVHVPTYFACLRAHVRTYFACSRASMPCMFSCSHGNVLCVLTCSRGNSYQQFFFEVKLFFCPVFYWDDKSLLIKVEARRVTRNAFRHNGSFKIMISQNQLGFVVIRLINNRHFIGVDPVKHIKGSFLQK